MIDILLRAKTHEISNDVLSLVKTWDEHTVRSSEIEGALVLAKNDAGIVQDTLKLMLYAAQDREIIGKKETFIRLKYGNVIEGDMTCNKVWSKVVEFLTLYNDQMHSPVINVFIVNDDKIRVFFKDDSMVMSFTKTDWSWSDNTRKIKLNTELKSIMVKIYAR